MNQERVIAPVSSFLRNFEDIRYQVDEFGFAGRVFLPRSVSAVTQASTDDASDFAAKMPHPLREKAGRRMVYGVPLIIFMDDVSGNVSKQWNKHHVIYISNGNMPREMVEKEFCVRFVTSSPFASPMELMRGCKESIG